jgi:ketosteroid isomerase-like protein
VSVDRTRETITAFLKDISGSGPFSRHLAADVTFTTMGDSAVIAGREAVERFIRHFHEEAFTAHTTVTLAVVDASQVLLELEFVGRHTGTFRGVAATGRPFRVPLGILFTIRDGEIIAMRGYLPLDRLMQQIGGTPPGSED